jgi:hypothetical protein
MVLANSKEQAVESFNAIKGTLEQSPILRKMITNITANTIILAKQRVQIIVCAADQATVRGYTLLAVWLSEFAHFTSNENFETYDLELLRSLKPGFFSTKGTIFMCSSPWTAEDNQFAKHCIAGFGDEGTPRTLVVHGASFYLNPTLIEDPELAEGLRDQERDDPVSYRVEVLAEWRVNRFGFLSGCN